MGLDVSAGLVVGIPADKALRVSSKTSTVTKYNENTGKPREVKVSADIYHLGNKSLTEAEFNELLERWQRYESDGELKLFDESCEEPDYKVFGVELAESGSHQEGGDTIAQAEFKEVAEAVDKVRKQLLDEYGIKEEPSVFAIAHMSY